MKKRLFLILSILAFGLFFVPNVASAEEATKTVNGVKYHITDASADFASVIGFETSFADDYSIAAEVEISGVQRPVSMIGIDGGLDVSCPERAFTVDATGATNLTAINDENFLLNENLTFKFKDNVTLKKEDYPQLEADTLLGNTYEYKGGDILYDADGTTVQGYKVKLITISNSNTICSSFECYDLDCVVHSINDYDTLVVGDSKLFITDSFFRIPDICGVPLQQSRSFKLSVFNWGCLDYVMTIRSFGARYHIGVITDAKLNDKYTAKPTIPSTYTPVTIEINLIMDDGFSSLCSATVDEVLAEIQNDVTLYFRDVQRLPRFMWKTNDPAGYLTTRVCTDDDLIIEMTFHGGADAEFSSCYGCQVIGQFSPDVVKVAPNYFGIPVIGAYFIRNSSSEFINMSFASIPPAQLNVSPDIICDSSNDGFSSYAVVYPVVDGLAKTFVNSGNSLSAAIVRVAEDTGSKLTVPASVRSLDYKSDINVTSLGSGTESVGQILTSVDLTSATNLTTINPYAFQGCTGLTTLTIPADVTTLSGSSFDGCTALTTLTFADRSPYEVVTDASGNKYITNTAGDTLIWFFDSNTATEFTIPDGITTIAKDAFTSGSKLRKVILPSTFSSLDADSFSFNGIVELPEYVDPDAWKANKTLVLTRTTQDLVYAEELGADFEADENNPVDEQDQPNESGIKPNAPQVYTKEGYSEENYSLKLQIREGAFVHPDDFRVSVNGIEQEFQTADENGVYTFALPLDAPTNNINIEAKYDAADIGKFIPGASSYAVLHTTYRTETAAEDPETPDA